MWVLLISQNPQVKTSQNSHALWEVFKNIFFYRTPPVVACEDCFVVTDIAKYTDFF